MILAAASVFILVTVAKVAPAYMEFATVKSMVDDIAADSSLAAPSLACTVGLRCRGLLPSKLAAYPYTA